MNRENYHLKSIKRKLESSMILVAEELDEMVEGADTMGELSIEDLKEVCEIATEGRKLGEIHDYLIFKMGQDDKAE